MPQWIRVLSIPILTALAGAAITGCAQTGYRTEVSPNGQGSYQITRVPLDSSPQPNNTSATPGAASANSESASSTSTPPAKSAADPDLAAIEDLWPSLSPNDRKTVTDLVRRLAATQP